MQLPVFFLSTIETALNAWLKLDGETLPRFASMHDQVICLHITGLNIKLYFLPNAQHIHVMGNYADKADTTIHGSAMTLMRMSSAQDSGKVLLASDAHIEGNIGLGTRFSQLLQDVDIDWEDLLSKLVGDIAAHQIGNLSRESAGWLKNTEHAMRLNLAEYLSEESHLLPAEAEVAYYLDQIDTMRMDTDRLTARVKRLKHKLDES